MNEQTEPAQAGPIDDVPEGPPYVWQDYVVWPVVRQMHRVAFARPLWSDGHSRGLQ